jgi:hypothetical protein
MGARIFRGVFLLPAFLLAVIFSVTPASAEGGGLIGTKTMNFSLPSQQGRLISYGDHYYGRHNLVVTFFPAAFTPV